MAPELTQQQPYNGEKVDIFAAGVILFLLATKTFPAFGRASKNDKKYKDFIQRKTHFWNSVYTDLKKMKGVGKDRADEILTAELQNLLDGMLHEDEKKRFSV
jgi:serine/threonine protein kinase